MCNIRLPNAWEKGIERGHTCGGQDRQRCTEVQTEAAIGQTDRQGREQVRRPRRRERSAGSPAPPQGAPVAGGVVSGSPALPTGDRAGGRAARRSGADMAALVEPLGLERGKRARGPCPPGRGPRPGPPPSPLPRQGPGGGGRGGAS